MNILFDRIIMAFVVLLSQELWRSPYHKARVSSSSIMLTVKTASQIALTDLPEKRVMLRNIPWQSFEQILDALGENRSAQLTYYKGNLEIMTPLEEHENSSSLIDDFVKVITEEQNLEIKSLQSTTLIKPELKVGAEPDQCYYLANEPAVRGKTVDLRTDPPPDLIVEVDITHTDIDKDALYAEMGVPEFWRYNGSVLRIYQLNQGQYQEIEFSPSFPIIPKAELYQFLQDCAEKGETKARKELRQRIKNQERPAES